MFMILKKYVYAAVEINDNDTTVNYMACTQQNIVKLEILLTEINCRELGL